MRSFEQWIPQHTPEKMLGSLSLTLALGSLSSFAWLYPPADILPLSASQRYLCLLSKALLSSGESGINVVLALTVMLIPHACSLSLCTSGFQHLSPSLELFSDDFQMCHRTFKMWTSGRIRELSGYPSKPCPCCRLGCPCSWSQQLLQVWQLHHGAFWFVHYPRQPLPGFYSVG